MSTDLSFTWKFGGKEHLFNSVFETNAFIIFCYTPFSEMVMGAHFLTGGNTLAHCLLRSNLVHCHYDLQFCV